MVARRTAAQSMRKLAALLFKTFGNQIFSAQFSPAATALVVLTKLNHDVAHNRPPASAIALLNSCRPAGVVGSLLSGADSTQ